MRGCADVGAASESIERAVGREEDTARSHVRARTATRTRQPVHTYAHVTEASASKIGHFPKPAIIDRETKSYVYVRDNGCDIDAKDFAESRFAAL